MNNKGDRAIFTTTQKNDCFYLNISKSLQESDIMQLDWMFQKALASTCNFILVDCCKMATISIPALRTFLANLGPVQSKGMRLGIFGLSSELMAALSSSGMDSLLTIAETEEDVIFLLKKKQSKLKK